MRNKILVRMELRDKGIEVLPSCYTKTGVICSFTLPPETMKKLKKLDLIYENRNELFKNLIRTFKLKKINKKKVWLNKDFLDYIENNKVKLSKTIKHKDYKFSSSMISTEDYERLKEICTYYRITRSSLIRVLIDSWKDYE